jgi:hypothetical protein
MSRLELPTTTRARAARLSRILAVVLMLTALLVLGERFSALLVRAAAQGFDDAARAALLTNALHALPELVQLGALVGVRRWLRAVADGEWSGEAIATTLRFAGWALLTGAVLALVVVPVAAQLSGVGEGYLVAYAPAQVVLGAVGLSLVLLAAVLRHARTLQAELDGFF